MKLRALISAAMLACPTAMAETLKASEIAANITGVWGWPGTAPDGVDRSCDGAPMRIWLENGGKAYRSQSAGETKVLKSAFGIPPDPNADYVLIRYTNNPQPGMFGKQLVWAIRMPDRDHFVWQVYPVGPKFPALERCAERAGPPAG